MTNIINISNICVFLLWKELVLEALKPYEKLANKKDAGMVPDSFYKQQPVASSTPVRELTISLPEIAISCYCGKAGSQDDPSYVCCTSCERYVEKCKHSDSLDTLF
jgi:hypothetical protein